MSTHIDPIPALPAPRLAVMIGSMIAGGWRRLTVVTALIALALAQFAVTVQAHPGHGHGGVAQTSVASGHDHSHTGHTYAAPSQPRDTRVALAACVKPAASVINIDDPAPRGTVSAGAGRGGDDTPAPSNCIGQCCGLGAACCGAALVSRSDELLPELAGRPSTDGAVTPLRSGIDPEALPEPPRPFV